MRRPNILIIYTDQQRWDTIRASGNPDVITPNLDRLAAQGVNFLRHFVQNPVCMPSRISFLTGQYPSTLRITHMAVPVPRRALTLPRLLRNYGYYSANIGKLHFLPHANRDHRQIHPDYGFDHLEISDEPGPYEDAYRAWVRRKAPDQLDFISVGLPPATEIWYRTMGIRDTIKHPDERFPKHPIPFPAPDHLTHTAFVAEQTIEFMEQRAASGRPFLCIAGIYSPHSPWVAPRRFIDMYDPATLTLPRFPEELDARRRPGHFDDNELRLARQGYYAMVSEVDFHLGRMMQALDELGIADNTIVVFTSDHGEWLGEHLRYGKGYPAHDCISRVPLILRGPGLPEGRVVDAIVEAVDVVPTLLDLAGIPLPPHLQGHSLLPLLDDGNGSHPRAALTEETGWKTLRTEHFRYVVHADGREFLYDLRDELGQYRDVSDLADYRHVIAEHRNLLLQRLIDMERPIPRVWPY